MKQHGRGKKSDSDSESDFMPDFDFENKNAKDEDQDEEKIQPRKSSRSSHSVSFDDFETKISDDSSSENEIPLDPVSGNGKIDKIYLARETLDGLEYLITFQESITPFSQWVSISILSQFVNYTRALQHFNELDSEFSFYSTQTHTFDTSFKGPLHIIGSRRYDLDTPRYPLSSSSQQFHPIENNFDQNDDNSNINNNTTLPIEYLYRLEIEDIGVTYYWELQTPDSPQNLIDYYESHLVSLYPFNDIPPPRPTSIIISPEECQTEFISHDNKVARDYQLIGVNWLLSCFCSNHGCILADEMGLGKTIQALLFLQALSRYSEYKGPYLIAVRTNTFSQWCYEIERWTNFSYIRYQGQPEDRTLLRQYAFSSRDGKGYGFQILLINYDMFLKDADVLTLIPWHIMIIDEGHRLKNRDGKKYNAFSKSKALHRIIMTGTPIQSTLNELWVLLNFVSPKYFVDPSVFPEDDVESLDATELDELKKLISPHLMHRRLLDVEHSLVPKEERVALLQITQAQKELTRLTLMRELYRITGGQADVNESNILYRICNHPFLIDGAEEYYEYRSQLTREELMISTSAKFNLLDRLLPIFKKEKRYVLIFSQRIKILNLLSDYCNYRGYSHELLEGSLNGNEKQTAINSFCDPEKDVFIFLLCTRSGAEGLNLTKASVAIIFDPDWNPQNDIQALGRCHRIGQTQKVDIIRFVTYGTYEHDMFARAQRKLMLWTTLLGNGVVSDPTQAKESIINKPLQITKTTSIMAPTIRNDTAMIDSIIISKTNSSEFISLKSINFNDNSNDNSNLNAHSNSNSKKKGFNEDNLELPAEPPEVKLISKKDRKNLEKGKTTFTEILESCSTVIKDIGLYRIPKLDFRTEGGTDEEFLSQFPIDNEGNSMIVQKRKNQQQHSNQKVQLDAIQAKALLLALSRRDYGDWENICELAGEPCSIEQTKHFCQAAIILNFRAIDAPLVSSFPLLLYVLNRDVKGFDLWMVMCKNEDEWYLPFSKRSILTGDAAPCRYIAGRIRKNAIPILSALEHRLLIQEFLSYNIPFPFDELPPAPPLSYPPLPEVQLNEDDKQREWLTRIEEDQDLFDRLIKGMEIDSRESPRIGQMFALMKSILIRQNNQHCYKIPFWTKPEIFTILSTFKNFGNILKSESPLELHSRSGLLSKTDVFLFMRSLYDLIAKRKAKNQLPLNVPDTLTQQYSSPVHLDPIEIPYSEIMQCIKRIMIIFQIRNIHRFFPHLLKDMSKECPGGKGWFNYNLAMQLFDILKTYGMDSLSGLLLSPDQPFRKHFAPQDLKFLETFEKNLLPNEEISKVPLLLRDENIFYKFLKSLSEKYQSTLGNQQKTPA